MELPDDCCVRLIDLPTGVRGFVCIDEEGFKNIYINARLSHDMSIESLAHEIDHIANDDIYNLFDIREVESRRVSNDHH